MGVLTIEPYFYMTMKCNLDASKFRGINQILLKCLCPKMSISCKFVSPFRLQRVNDTLFAVLMGKECLKTGIYTQTVPSAIKTTCLWLSPTSDLESNLSPDVTGSGINAALEGRGSEIF